MKRVLVPIATGTEEIECVTVIDTLVRAGASVEVASVMSHLEVVCSRGVKIVATKLIGECTSEAWDLIVLPGGIPGANHLRDSEDLVSLLRKQRDSKKLLAAICASPAVVLATHSLLDGKTATCYPAQKFREALPRVSDEVVVVDDELITSQGPGTSLAFSLTLVKALYGSDKADSLAKEMIHHGTF